MEAEKVQSKPGSSEAGPWLTSHAIGQFPQQLSPSTNEEAG